MPKRSSWQMYDGKVSLKKFILLSIFIFYTVEMAGWVVRASIRGDNYDFKNP